MQRIVLSPCLVLSKELTILTQINILSSFNLGLVLIFEQKKNFTSVQYPIAIWLNQNSVSAALIWQAHAMMMTVRGEWLPFVLPPSSVDEYFLQGLLLEFGQINVISLFMQKKLAELPKMGPCKNLRHSFNILAMNFNILLFYFINRNDVLGFQKGNERESS